MGSDPFFAIQLHIYIFLSAKSDFWKLILWLNYHSNRKKMVPSLKSKKIIFLLTNHILLWVCFITILFDKKFLIAFFATTNTTFIKSQISLIFMVYKINGTSITSYKKCFFMLFSVVVKVHQSLVIIYIFSRKCINHSNQVKIGYSIIW